MKYLKLIILCFHTIIIFTARCSDPMDSTNLYCGYLVKIELREPFDEELYLGTREEFSIGEDPLNGTKPQLSWKPTGDAYTMVYLFNKPIELDPDTCQIMNKIDAIWQWASTGISSFETSIIYKEGSQMTDGTRKANEDLIDLADLMWETNPDTGLLDLYWIILTRNRNGDLSGISEIREFTLIESSN
jgi:hypothetical protein